MKAYYSVILMNFTVIPSVVDVYNVLTFYYPHAAVTFYFFMYLTYIYMFSQISYD